MATRPIQEYAIAYMDVAIMRHIPFIGYYDIVIESVMNIDGEVKIHYLKKIGSN